MALLSKQSVKDLIAENYNTYKSHSRITSDYRGEKGLTEAYNGRQLLEMLQNADDAQTDKVLLHLDTENTILTIANNGIPFDIKGLGSLMLANNSPKNKRDFIGNKGLGFRSILNWVDAVKIKTKEYVLEFSKEIAKREFEYLIPDYATRQHIIENEKDLPNGDVPFAVLSIPDFKENTVPQDWETIVELKYKKDEEGKILEQLKTITPEVLLFLNHTTSIQIAGAGVIDNELVLTPSRDLVEKTIMVNENTWNLFDSGEKQIPNNTEKFFKYKIAWRNDLSDTETCFATYFPTQVATHLPYLIHATFDLDPSRNQLNKSDDNGYILNQIATTLKGIASAEMINKNQSDWKALDFLTIDGKSENRLLDNFYRSIENTKNALAIYPSVDGQYRTINEVKYYGNEFSEWVLLNKLGEFFPYLILPIPSNQTLIKEKIISKYTIEEWKQIFEVVTHKIISIEERVKLIKLLTTDLFQDFHGTYLPLLIDDKEKSPVSSDFETYILKKADTDSYQIPDYVKIAFIDGDFYYKLERVFNEEIEKSRINPNEHKSRVLKKIISPIVNFGSNDITDVVRNITRAFNSYVEEDASYVHELVKPFIHSLFQIYKQKKEGEKTAVDNIQVLNREGKLVLTSDVFLGKEYYFGKITEKLFEGIFNESQYIKGNEFWNLDVENQSADYLDSFFVWLGVNKYTKFNTLKKSLQRWENDDYTNYVFNIVGFPEYDSYKNYEVSLISNFEQAITKNFPIEKIIVWIIQDRKLFAKLDSENNGELFSYTFGGKTTQINWKPSYFMYQITKSNLFKNVFVNFEYANFLGLQSVDPKHSIFVELGIDDTAVMDTLKKLGAKMSFNDLSVEAVYTLLDCLKTKNIDSKNARKLYQQVFSYFRSHKEINYQSFKKQTHLLAVKNQKSEYKLTQEVYYSDNTTLPSKIIENFWIFDFPKRCGEKQLAEYFGVKTFKDIDIKIQKNIIFHPKSEEFNRWYDIIKPYLLTYRLDNIKAEDLSTNAVNAIKNCSIKIVASLDYSIDGSESKKLLPNEFINDDKHTFFIGADSYLNLEQLKETPAFCEAFSEILCVLFEVNENKDDFRAIFKDKEHLKDTKYQIKTKMLTDKYEEACQLLGLSKNEILFWKAITLEKIDNFPEVIANNKQLQSIVTLAINYKLPDYYFAVNFASFNNQQSYNFINEICSSLELTLTDIKLRLDNFIGLNHYHLSKFTQIAIDLEVPWNKTCWLDLSIKPKEEQTKFENKRNLYLLNRQKIIEKLALKFSWDFEVNYEEVFIEYLNAEYHISIQKENLIGINLEYKYQKLIKEYNINTEELRSDLKSLLFFEGHEEELKVKFSELLKQETETAESTDIETGTTESAIAIITSIGIGNAPANKANTGLGNKKGGVHSQKKEIQNKKAGKKAEKLVRDKLLELYPDGEIRWISGNSEDNSVKLDDTKGYDISYKKNKTDEQWIYLEVKSSSNGNSFIISANEVNVGIENKESYHLAIVNGLNITFVEDFFINETRLAEFNALRNSPSIRPLDYEVYFKFDKIDECIMI
jgi:hypothetical protein